MDAVAQRSNLPTWVFILEGVALTLFGVAAIAWPGMTLYAFTVIFGLYALVAGIANVIGGIFNIRSGWHAIGMLALGALLIASGSYVLNHPGITAATMVLFVAFTFLIRGIVEIVLAISQDSPHKVLAIVSAIFAILVGFILLRHPIGGGLAYVWVIGIYALVSGPIMLAVGLGAGKDKPQRPSHEQPSY